MKYIYTHTIYVILTLYTIYTHTRHCPAYIMLRVHNNNNIASKFKVYVKVTRVERTDDAAAMNAPKVVVVRTMSLALDGNSIRVALFYFTWHVYTFMLLYML